MAARRPRTWWRRWVVVLIAAGLMVFVFVTVGRWMGASRIGGQIFAVLGGAAMTYALLGGPLSTVDCLSRERREGTLGLMFLTDLRSHDIVLGKMAAASLDLVFGLAAVLPLVAIPFLMGGVTFTQFLYVILAVLNLLFVSLSIGVCASAFVVSGRAALGLTLGTLLLMAFGLLVLVEEILPSSWRNQAAPWICSVCPIYTMVLSLDDTTAGTWKYWLNFGATHALAWACLGAACWRTASAWRDLPVFPALARMCAAMTRWGQGNARLRAKWRAGTIERNPMSWLEERDWLQRRILWSLVLVSALGWAVAHAHGPLRWPDGDWVYLWPLLTHYALCLWIAVQAPRRLADDKQSGALELLLCTPLAPARIVKGCMGAFWRRFGWPLLAMMALDAFLAYAYLSAHGAWRYPLRDDLWVIGKYALFVMPFQGYSFWRVGLYEGLVLANSTRASIRIIWRLGLLPWVVWLGFIILCESTGAFRRVFRISEEVAFGSWAAAHVLICGFFLIRAELQLRRNFRWLAEQRGRLPWWRRWFSAGQKA